jgi:hypothetical protein
VRQVIIKPYAARAIQAVADFIESKNTPGSSDKWVNEIINFIASRAQLNLQSATCKNADLARRNFLCIIFKRKWVILSSRQGGPLLSIKFFMAPS